MLQTVVEVALSDVQRETQQVMGCGEEETRRAVSWVLEAVTGAPKKFHDVWMV